MGIDMSEEIRNTPPKIDPKAVRAAAQSTKKTIRDTGKHNVESARKERISHAVIVEAREKLRNETDPAKREELRVELNNLISKRNSTNSHANNVTREEYLSSRNKVSQ